MGRYTYEKRPEARQRFIEKWRVKMEIMEKNKKKRKPYPLGSERGKWVQVCADMKPSDQVEVPGDEIGRARWAMTLLWGPGSVVTRKIKNKDEGLVKWKMWRLF